MNAVAAGAARGSGATMRTALKTAALVLAVSFGARASGGGDAGLVFIDLFFNVLTLGLEVAALDQAVPPPQVSNAPPPPEGNQQRRADVLEQDEPPPYWRAPRRRFQSREGLLLSVGLGGGSMYVSSESPLRTGAFDLDFRLGYGFSDRFQFFMDLGVDTASYRYAGYPSDDVVSWSFTFRGQTVLIGDRAGNGLNVNFGLGIGGITRNSGTIDQQSSSTGLAVAGGLSYDARLTPLFAISPELFVTWHAIPNGQGIPQDVASVYGLRVNFLWYLH